MKSVFPPLLLGSLSALFFSVADGHISRDVDYQLPFTLRCPLPCSVVGADPAGWTYYNNADALDRCEQPTIFQMNIYNPVADPRTHVLYRACVASYTSNEKIRRQHLSFNPSEPSQVKLPLNLASSGSSASPKQVSSVSTAISQMSGYMQQHSAYSTSLFARSGKVVAGMYVGLEIEPTSAASVVQKFLEHLSSASAVPERQAAQICQTSNSTSSAQTFGVIYDTTGDLAAVQSALSSWDGASCIRGSASNKVLQDVSINLIPGTKIDVAPPTTGHPSVNARSELIERTTCKYLEVQSGNTCSSLAQSCGITMQQFESYNGGASECSQLQPGQYVCCSSGSPPNFAPQPYANGTCYTYTIQSGDTCSAIANAHQMQLTVLENSNNQTWGWQGCSDLLIGMNICLSSGIPPYPSNVPNSVCGPQVNNTVFPSDPTKWAALNPCPLNACCDIHGPCGITSDFCTPSESSIGAPETAAPGSNGCISNCGTQIVSSPAPATFARMGYFEAFNEQRPCLNMVPSDIPSVYTHVHFAFANITSNFYVDVSGLEDMFNDFLNTPGFNRILSFGGWAFSTDPSTYPIFRSGVTAANRLSFAHNVANFVQSYNLQGVDFDWEYPGPSIIPGIPNGSPEDGANYLAFLQDLRAVLPSNYSISITAPSSFYYLQNFPIYEMSQIVNYIVFMTYDLHGQWDYGNQYTDPGCPAGNCLRSQVNQTETQSAFSMITKAGVPANMIMVGQPLYGRSFQMNTPGCYTEMCTYTGPQSGALPGYCTGTPGYISNWEINQIISNSQYSSSVNEYYSPTALDILVYDSTQWISWMKPSSYNSRMSWAQDLNFGGVCDWAMDLNASYAANGSQIGEGSGVVYVPPSIYSSASPTVTCLPPCTFVFPPWTLASNTTITVPATTMTLSEMWPEVTTLSGGVTYTIYVTSTTVTTITIPPITTDTISVWNVEWTNTANNTLYLTSSIVPPPVTLTEGNDKTSTTTLAGIIWTYAPPAFPPPPVIYPPVIHPPPGYSIGSIPVVHGPPSPTCLPGESDCRNLCVTDCSPNPPCLGICGCIGLGCPSGGSCIGPGCVGGGGGGGGEGGSEPETEICATSTTVTDCEVACSITDYGDTSFATNCYTTSCSRSVGCQKVGATSTTATTTAMCPASGPSYATWVPQSGQQLPFLGTDDQWTTPGGSTPPPTSPTTSPTTTKTTSTSPPPNSASAGQMLVFTDSNCQDFYYSTTLNSIDNGCYKFGSPINSYIIGPISDCGCPGSAGFCEWETFVITTSSGCGYDDQVGGGCNAPKCTKTTAPAQYNTAELTSNGICKREVNGTIAYTEGVGPTSPDGLLTPLQRRNIQC